MLGKSSSSYGSSPTEEVPIGEAISNGLGLFANEIQQTRDNLEITYGSLVSNSKLYISDMGADVLGMSDGNGVHLNSLYASNTKMTEAMKDAEKSGFHPKLGGRTGAEAVTAHELGHHIARQIEARTGVSQERMVEIAGKRLGLKKESVAVNISEYARYNYHETIAESFADVYCNGTKASKASRAVVDVVKSYLK